MKFRSKTKVYTFSHYVMLYPRGDINAYYIVSLSSVDDREPFKDFKTEKSWTPK